MQTRLKFLLFISLLSLFSSISLAKENDTAMSVSIVGMNMDYREYDNNGIILDSEKSDFVDLKGFELTHEWYFGKNEKAYSELGINFMLLAGKTAYVGSLLDSNLSYGSYTSSTSNSVGDIDITYKYNYLLNDSLEVKYGIGLGYRYWYRGLSSTQEELYYWFSLRPLFGINLKILENLSVAPIIEYQYGVLPTMYESTTGHNFKLSSADIIEISVPLNYILSKKIDIFFEYVYQQQKIGESDKLLVSSNRYLYEPDSTANNQYIKFGMVFKY